jgi:hypothetical protein
MVFRDLLPHPTETEGERAWEEDGDGEAHRRGSDGGEDV